MARNGQTTTVTLAAAAAAAALAVGVGLGVAWQRWQLGCAAAQGATAGDAPEQPESKMGAGRGGRVRQGSKEEKRRSCVWEGGEWTAELREATTLAWEAGERMRKATQDKRADSGLEYKGVADLVTATDRENEQQIFARLRAAFPDYAFIGEEATAAASVEETRAQREALKVSGKCVWICDPVDGTTNFLHGLPCFCVSIGLVRFLPSEEERSENGEDFVVLLGVVYDPINDELFQAVRGLGAFLNGKRIYANTTTTRLVDALVLSEFGSQRSTSALSAIMTACRRVLAAEVHAVRSLGSGVLDLCYIACGRVDALYCGVAGEGFYPWDFCAAHCIVSEAGGCFLQIDGTPFDLFARTAVCAGSADLATSLVGVIDIGSIKGHVPGVEMM